MRNVVRLWSLALDGRVAGLSAGRAGGAMAAVFPTPAVDSPAASLALGQPEGSHAWLSRMFDCDRLAPRRGPAPS
ncbi:MAG: hypothetical protein JWP21_1697 [Tardiphaga sp.]|nr:hypothetical protein [Tardiphaga sp.]